jgi:sugar phosphate isomerase/epimerase
MNITVFTDELGLDVFEAAPHIKDWGAPYVDLRANINGKAVHLQSQEELKELKKFLDDQGLAVACLESSLGKKHLPDAEALEKEWATLEGLIQAADILDCRLIRSFYHWQPKRPQLGLLSSDDGLFNQVIESFFPIAQKAHEAGLVLAFENCGCHTHETHRVIEEFHRRGLSSCGQAWDVFHSFEEKPRDLRSFANSNAKHTKIIHVKAKRCTFLGDETSIPYTDIFRMVHSTGYRGPVAIETHNHDKALDNLEASHRLFRAVKAALVEADVLTPQNDT